MVQLCPDDDGEFYVVLEIVLLKLKIFNGILNG